MAWELGLDWLDHTLVYCKKYVCKIEYTFTRVKVLTPIIGMVITNYMVTLVHISLTEGF